MPDIGKPNGTNEAHFVIVSDNRQEAAEWREGNFGFWFHGWEAIMPGAHLQCDVSRSGSREVCEEQGPDCDTLSLFPWPLLNQLGSMSVKVSQSLKAAPSDGDQVFKHITGREGSSH